MQASYFLDTYFHDTKLSQKEFIQLAETELSGIQDHNDKIKFVAELVKRGKEFLNNSIQNLTMLEKRDLAKEGIHILK